MLVQLDVSIIFGCYNAAPDLAQCVSLLYEMLERRGSEFEIVAVDDGSADSSLKELERLSGDFPALRTLRNPRNMGKGFSVRNGVLNSSGEKVVFVDADMAYAIENVAAVLDALDEGAGMVVANRRLPESVYTAHNSVIRYVYRRHRLGAAFNRLVRILYGIRTRDTQSGLKGFRREIAEAVFPRIVTDRFLFDVEIFIMASAYDIDIREIPVHVTFDSDDSTAAHFHTFLRVAPELVRIKYNQLRGMYRPAPASPTRDG